MNEYPVWWETTLTVFNKHQDAQTQVITWTKTAIPNCFWKDVGEKISVGDVVLETDNIICRIPKDDKFLESSEWSAKPNDVRGNYFTLQQGDIIVRGAVTDVINEYSSGHRSTDLLKKYKNLQGCMTIQKVGINIGKGRCNEHYYVKGI